MEPPGGDEESDPQIEIVPLGLEPSGEITGNETDWGSAIGAIPFRNKYKEVFEFPVHDTIPSDSYTPVFEGIPSLTCLFNSLEQSSFRKTTFNGEMGIYPDYRREERSNGILTVQVIRHYYLRGQTFTIKRCYDSGEGYAYITAASDCIYAVLYRTTYGGEEGSRQVVVGYAYTTSGIVPINWDTGTYYGPNDPINSVLITSSATGSDSTINVDTLSSYALRL